MQTFFSFGVPDFYHVVVSTGYNESPIVLLSKFKTFFYVVNVLVKLASRLAITIVLS